MHAQVLFAIAGAGAIGAVCRYSLGHLVLLLLGSPWHTAIVNVLGCFGFGLVMAIYSARWSPLLTTAVLAGFFGAFTTFSAFAFDGVALIREGRWLLFAVDLVAQNVLGLVAMWGGITLGGGFPTR